MDLFLNRKLYTKDGVFGILLSDQGELLFTACEHAYPDFHNPGGFTPKVPEGVYTCIRGKHQLAHMTEPFETFEVTGVEGHDGILFHVGNSGEDSSGCILLGEAMQYRRLINSRIAFNKFMELQKDVNEFQIVIQDIDSEL